MSLLSEHMEKVVRMDRKSVPDREGSFKNQWTEGSEFAAAISFDNSIEAKIAEKQGVTSRYSVIIDKGVELNYHDVFKRLCDGKIFRVTSDGDDNQTPKSAGLQIRMVSAEEWSLA